MGVKIHNAVSIVVSSGCRVQETGNNISEDPQLLAPSAAEHTSSELVLRRWHQQPIRVPRVVTHKARVYLLLFYGCETWFLAVAAHKWMAFGNKVMRRICGCKTGERRKLHN
jgi:hypothetical protein